MKTKTKSNKTTATKLYVFYSFTAPNTIHMGMSKTVFLLIFYPILLTNLV